MLAIARAASRQATVAACRRAPAVRAPVAPQLRGFSGAASAKILKTLTAEIKHEEEQYEQPKEIKSFLANSDFKYVEAGGDANMALEREVGGRTIRIEWQLTSPFNPDAEMEGAEGEDAMEQEATDFSVTIENKEKGNGLAFYCSTMTGEDYRYVVGNVKAFATSEERDSASAYNGPDFEDVDEKLQEALDEYLAETGVNNEICDFIDATALDKEQREYTRWLKVSKEFLA